MEVIRALVVDDEKLARDRLIGFLGQLQGVAVVGQATNGVEAVESIEREKPDLVFLDVQMPGMDGFEVLKAIPGPAPHVVFATAYDDYAIRAFEVYAIDYLLKPIRLARLKEALARARSAPPRAEALRAVARAARTHLSAQERGKIHLIPLADVVYLKAELKYVTVRTAAREYLIEESLTRLEEEFGERFVRIHRNCLVARAYVTGFERENDEEGEGRWLVLLRGVEEKLPVSRRQQHVVKELAY